MNEWQRVEGTGWIDIPGYGRINPRQDNVDGGRQYFTAMTDADTYARVVGGGIRGGPETWQFTPDDPFWLSGGECDLEVVIALLPGGRYGVRYREGSPPETTGGGWLAE